MKPIEIYTKLKEVTDAAKNDVANVLVALRFVINEIENEHYKNESKGNLLGAVGSSVSSQHYVMQAKDAIREVVREEMASNSGKSEKEAA